MDKERKQLMLRYAQIIFSNESGRSNVDDERELAEIRQKVSCTHEQIMECVKRNLLEGDVEC